MKYSRQYRLCSCLLERSAEKQKKRSPFTPQSFITQTHSFLPATAREKSRTNKEPYSTLLTPWKAWSLALWIAHVTIILLSMKPSLFWCLATRKQKSITTGRSFLLIHEPNNVAG